jgi:hypothetical protein
MTSSAVLEMEEEKVPDQSEDSNKQQEEERVTGIPNTTSVDS